LNNSRRLRVAIFLLNGVFTVQLLVATVAHPEERSSECKNSK
jgi:hypothetical protein